MRPAGRVFTAREQEEGAVRVQGRKKKTETAIFEELLVTTDGGRSERLSNVAVLFKRSEEREGRGTC